MSRITYRDERGNAQIAEYYDTKAATAKLAAYEDMGIPAVDTSVLTGALYTYGEEPQVDMMIEEMSELTKALLKHRRAQYKGCQFNYDRECVKAVVEEMADVYIVLLQMIHLYDAQDLLDTYVRDKILRLNVWLFTDGKDEAEGETT